MHVAKRAIIMAAGIGKRMHPLTLITPKPLVEVNGVRMIDTVIQALQKNGICDIYIVVGYQKEKFYELAEDYNGIHLIQNPFFERCNNISSLYAAREFLGECVIVDGDQVIYQPEVFKRTFSKSSYCCKWTEKQTKEWLLDVQADKVVRCRIGGCKGWQLYGISFWTKDDGMRMRYNLEQEFEIKKNYQRYWDEVALFCYPKEYDLGIREVQEGDIVEIDSLTELIQIDSRYRGMLLEKTLQNIRKEG